MPYQLAFTFAIISAICSIILITIFVHYLLSVYHRISKSKSIDPLVKRCGTISLFGYTIFVFISFILDVIASLWYIPSVNIEYTKIICQLQTFNIVFFMTGKLAMYLFFMSLVYVSFRGSYLAYSSKILGSLAIGFFAILCVIGGFYMVLLYLDFGAVNSIKSPDDCQQFTASKYTTRIIWTGATFDAMWSFICLLLFTVRLKSISDLMKTQTQLELSGIESKCTSTTESVIKNNANGSPITLTPIQSINSHNIDDLRKIDFFSADDKVIAGHNKQDSTSMIQSIQVKLVKFKKKINDKKKKTPDIAHTYLPIMLKLIILSTWCALSTTILGFGLWTVYPTLASVIDSTINALCVYLAHRFTNKLYLVLCLPFLQCSSCDKYKTVIEEADEIQRKSSSTQLTQERTTTSR